MLRVKNDKVNGWKVPHGYQEAKKFVLELREYITLKEVKKDLSQKFTYEVYTDKSGKTFYVEYKKNEIKNISWINIVSGEKETIWDSSNPENRESY